MKTSFQRIVTEDGIELVGLLYEPEKQTDTVLVHVHGMAGNFYENSFLDFLATTLTSNGIAFFSFNNRGCELIKDLTKFENGKKTLVRIGNAFEKFEDSKFDIKVAIDFVSKQGFSDIHLSGHSLGSPKVAYYLSSQKDERIKSVLFISPADMVGLSTQTEDYKRDIETAEKMISEGRSDELMPFIVWGENQLSANTYMSIGGKDSAVAIFNFHNPNDSMDALGSITIPAVTLMGKKDEALVIPVEDTMERMKEAMASSTKVETVIVGEANHAYSGHEQQLADAVSSWIQNLN